MKLTPAFTPSISSPTQRVSAVMSMRLIVWGSVAENLDLDIDLLIIFLCAVISTLTVLVFAVGSHMLMPAVSVEELILVRNAQPM
jgi:hypothetical protein